MINKITFKDEPALFNEIAEFSIHRNSDHRRGSNFFVSDIVELKPEHKQYFPDVNDFEKYLGLWKTNTIIWDDNNGFDGESYSELTRVEKKEVITYNYVEVKNETN